MCEAMYLLVGLVATLEREVLARWKCISLLMPEVLGMGSSDIIDSGDT